ncbi:MAG: BatA domain-containing protein [Pirellulaceae bacterium]
MTFLNGVLTFGAAAFVIPLVIHLLNRSRFRTVPWGAMHLLESILRVNHKWIRLEQILLLLVRCAIPALLAFCLARPVLTGWRVLPGDAPNSTVLLLDNSYSMDAVGGDRPHWEEAIDHACAILDSRVRGTEVSVIRTGGGPTPVFDRPVFDPKTMSQQVRHLQGGYGASEIADSFDSALEVLAAMTHSRRDLIWIGDFQRSDWDAVPPETLDRIRQQLAAMPIRPAVTLMQVGKKVEDNVAVDSLSFSSRALGVGQDFQIRANLRNHGSKYYPNARVLFRVDDRQLAISQVNLGTEATSQVLFTHQFTSPGSHVVEIEVAVDDKLETDNRFAAAVNVLDQIPILLVDGAPRSEPLESETDFLAVALTPFTFGRVQLSDLLQTRTVSTRELNEEAVTGVNVVVLANVPKLSDEQVTLLNDYVRGGGSLLVFVGNKIDVDWYNRTLANHAGGLLPMPIGPLLGSPDDTGSSNHIIAQHFDHPALEIFNDRANGNLADADIRRWYRLGGPDKTADQDRTSKPLAGEEDGALVLCRLESGDPLIVEERFGSGVVFQVAIPCDADWSNLPMRPCYVPLMQQLMTTLASQVTPPNNLQTGDPFVALLPGNASGIPLSLTAPDGGRHTVRPVARGIHSVVEFNATQQPGVYTLNGPDGKPHHFVVETSRSESDLRLLDARDLESLATTLGADLVRTGTEYVALDRTRRHGREIWRFLFWGVLGLMCLELVLQQRFARVRR